MTRIPFPSTPDQSVDLPQGTVRYRDVGTGPVLVFVAGYVADGRLWREVVPRLAADFRCIVPDWPFGAHSVPMKPDADLSAGGIADIVGAFLEALDLQEVTLVGNDSGGGVSQVVVARYPDRIARLVLTPCDAFEKFPPALFAPLKVIARIPGATWVLGRSLGFKAIRHSPTGFGWVWKHPDAELTRSWVEPVRTDPAIRRDLKKITLGLDKRFTLEAAERHKEFTRPVLVAWAEDDKFFKWDLGERLARSYPNARLERVADSYAFAPLDQPDRIADLISSFVREPVPA